MKKQVLLTLTFMMISCFSSTITAQVATKKKAATATVKKAIVGANKKKSTAAPVNTKASTPKKETPVPAENNAFGRYKCKVTKTNTGCNITFEHLVDPKSELAKKENYATKREFKVSYKDNSVTNLSADLVSEKKIKSEVASIYEEQVNTSPNSDQSVVEIKELNFNFELSNGNKDSSFGSTEYLLPAQLPDGYYVLKINWNWDLPSDKVQNSHCTLVFKILVKEGMITGINN